MLPLRILLTIILYEGYGPRRFSQHLIRMKLTEAAGPRTLMESLRLMCRKYILQEQIVATTSTLGGVAGVVETALLVVSDLRTAKHCQSRSHGHARGLLDPTKGNEHSWRRCARLQRAIESASLLERSALCPAQSHWIHCNCLQLIRPRSLLTLYPDHGWTCLNPSTLNFIPVGVCPVH